MSGDDPDLDKVLEPRLARVGDEAGERARTALANPKRQDAPTEPRDGAGQGEGPLHKKVEQELRPAGPSERIETASGPVPLVKTKTMDMHRVRIDPKVDPRKAPTQRRIQSPAPAALAEQPPPMVEDPSSFETAKIGSFASAPLPQAPTGLPPEAAPEIPPTASPEPAKPSAIEPGAEAVAIARGQTAKMAPVAPSQPPSPAPRAASASDTASSLEPLPAGKGVGHTVKMAPKARGVGYTERIIPAGGSKWAAEPGLRGLDKDALPSSHAPLPTFRRLEAPPLQGAEPEAARRHGRTWVVAGLAVLAGTIGVVAYSSLSERAPDRSGIVVDTASATPPPAIAAAPSAEASAAPSSSASAEPSASASAEPSASASAEPSASASARPSASALPSMSGSASTAAPKPRTIAGPAPRPTSTSAWDRDHSMVRVAPF